MYRFARHIFIFLFLLSGSASFAKTWYVSPKTDKNGCRPQGNGSEENPWDLQTAFSGAKGMIMPGDTVYVHGGENYWGYYQLEQDGKPVHAPRLYTTALKGSDGHPIIVKAFPGERPVLDGGPNTSAEAVKLNQLSNMNVARTVLTISGVYTWYWGLEITNSSPRRQSYYAEGTDLNFAEGIVVSESNHIKLINLIVHDNTSTGIAAFSKALNTEIEGCLIYYNGFTGLKSTNPKYGGGTFRNNGPGIYSQNTDDSSNHSKKIIKNNVVFEQFYNGMQIYGSPNAFADRFDIIDNTVFNNGLISSEDTVVRGVFGHYNILVGSHKDAYNNRIIGNQCCFFTRFGFTDALKIGYNDNHSTHRCQANDNIIVSSCSSNEPIDPPLLITNPVDFEFKNNLIYGRQVNLWISNSYLPQGDHKREFDSKFHSDYNTYLYYGKPRDGYHYFLTMRPNYRKGTDERNYTLNKLDKANYIDSVGTDAHSADMTMAEYRKDKSKALKVIITPDDYEPGLTKIVVFNWDSLQEININTANLVPENNEYGLIDVQNFPAGAFQSGKYNGKLTVKMNSVKTTVPTGLKGTYVERQPDHTDARFGVFWLQYFPYKVSLKQTGGNLTAHFQDVNGKEVKHPPFLTYQWKHNGSAMPSSNTSVIHKPADGEYEVTMKDDKGLSQTSKIKIAGGKTVN